MNMIVLLVMAMLLPPTRNTSNKIPARFHPFIHPSIYVPDLPAPLD